MGAELTRAFKTAAALCITVIVCACGSDNSANDSTTVTIENQVDHANETSKADPLESANIAESIYFNRRTPENFYREPERDRSNFYIISHIKSNEVSNANPTSKNNVPYELCSQEFTQALEWSEQETLNQSSYQDLVDNNETDIFYEFTRVNSNSPNSIYLDRVFKCELFNKASITENDDSIGTISRENINVDNIKTLIDYLWSISSHNNYGFSVLDTYTDSNDTHFIYNMFEARISFMASAGGCDTIDVDKITYTVNRITGMILSSKETVKTISAKIENNEYRVCE